MEFLVARVALRFSFSPARAFEPWEWCSRFPSRNLFPLPRAIIAGVKRLGCDRESVERL